MKHSRPEQNAPTLPAAARDALLLGNTIEAIKVMRTDSAMSLRDAKQFIEDQARIDPELARAILRAHERSMRALKITAMAIGGMVLLVLTYVVILRPTP